MAGENKKNEIELVEIEEIEARRNKEVLNTKRAELAVRTADGLDLSAIFITVGHTFFEIAKYVTFPLAIVLSLTTAGLTWRQAYLNKWRTRFLVGALIETGSALAITAAIIGAFTLTTIFALVAPIIFTAVLSFKSLFNAGASIFYGVKAAREKDPVLKAEHTRAAIRHATISIATGLAAVGVGLSMLLGKVALAGLAVAGGILAATITTVSLVRTFINKPKDTVPSESSTLLDKPSIFDIAPAPTKEKSTKDCLDVFATPVDKKVVAVEEKIPEDKKVAAEARPTLFTEKNQIEEFYLDEKANAVVVPRAENTPPKPAPSKNITRYADVDPELKSNPSAKALEKPGFFSKLGFSNPSRFDINPDYDYDQTKRPTT